MNLVIDASTVVAALVDNGPIGSWAEELLRTGGQLVAPALMPTAAANVLRRLDANGALDSTSASLAFADLQRLPILPMTFGVLSDRIWSLRENLTSYDASYVATAELIDAPLATLDQKLANAPGTRCEFLLPD